MQQSALNYDKVMKPVTRAVESLKRDKELKRQFSEVIKKVEKLESAADDITKFKSVVDEKSYDQKVCLLKNLQQACANAINEVTRRSKLMSKEDPKKKVSDNPALEALASSLDAFKCQADKDLEAFDKWFNKESKPGTFEVNVPRDVTDMIAMADAKGRIGMPSDQSFDATITLSYKDRVPNLGTTLEKKGHEFVGEIGRALAPLKQDVARAFKAWNTEFAKIESKFERQEAEELFKTINKWFSEKLPKLVEPALKAAAKQALKDACSGMDGPKDVESKVDIEVKCDYSNIAEFKLKFPDNPADDLTKSLSKSFDSMASAEKGYNEAVKAILGNYKAVGDSIEELQKELQAGAKNPGDAKRKFDPDERLKAMSKATSELESNLKDGVKSSEALAGYLAPINKKLTDSKGALKDNATIKTADVERLSKDLSAALKELKGPVPGQLKKLDESVKASKEIQDTVTGLGGSDKSLPKAEDLKKALATIKKASAAFSTKPAEVQKSLTIPVDVDKLKSLTENLKS